MAVAARGVAAEEETPMDAEDEAAAAGQTVINSSDFKRGHRLKRLLRVRVKRKRALSQRLRACWP